MPDLSKKTIEDLAGSQNSVRTDRGSFLANVKIISENDCSQKQIILVVSLSFSRQNDILHLMRQLISNSEACL